MENLKSEMEQLYEHIDEKSQNGQSIQHFQSLKAGDVVQQIAISEDGATMAIGGQKSQLVLYDISDLEQISRTQQLDTRDDCSVCLKFMKNKRLLSIGQKSIILIQDLQGNVELKIAQQTKINCADISINQKYVLTGNEDDLIRVYSVQKQLLVNEVKIGYTNIQVLQCSKIFEFVCAYSGQEIDLKLINYKKNETIMEINDIDGDINTLDFSNDGKKIVIAGTDSKIRIYETLNGCQIQKFTNFSTQDIKCIRFSKSDKSIITGGNDGMIRVFDFDSGTQSFSFSNNSQPLNCIDFIKNDKFVVSGAENGDIMINKLQKINLLKLDSKSGQINCIAKARNGSKIVIGTDDNCLKVYQIADLVKAFEDVIGVYDEEPSLVQQCDSDITNIALADKQDGMYSELCCYSTKNKQAIIIDLVNKHQKEININQNSQTTAICFYDNNDRILIAQNDMTLKVYNVERDQIHVMIYTDNIINCIFASADNKYLTFCGQFSWVYLVNLEHQSDFNMDIVSENSAKNKRLISISNYKSLLNDDQNQEEDTMEYQVKSLNKIIYSKNNLQQKTIQQLMHQPDNQYKKVIISDDNKLIAAVSNKRVIRMFHLEQKRTQNLYQNKKNISDIKFGIGNNRTILFGGDNVYSEVIDTETKDRQSNIVDDLPNVSEIVYLNESIIGCIGKDPYVYIQSTQQTETDEFKKLILYFIQNKNKNAENIHVSKEFRDTLGKKIHKGINFIMYIFLYYLFENAAEMEVMDKISLISKIIDVLKVNQIFIHFSYESLDKDINFRFYHIYNLLPVTLQNTFIEYLINCQDDIECQLCNYEIQNILLIRLQQGKTHGKYILDWLIDKHEDYQILDCSIDKQICYFTSKQNYLDTFSIVINSDNQRNRQFNEQIIQFYYLNYPFHKPKVISKDPEQAIIDKQTYLNTDIIQLISRNYGKEDEIYSSQALSLLVKHMWNFYGAKQYYKKFIFFLISFSIYFVQIFYFGARKLLTKFDASNTEVMEDQSYDLAIVIISYIIAFLKFSISLYEYIFRHHKLKLYQCSNHGTVDQFEFDCHLSHLQKLRRRAKNKTKPNIVKDMLLDLNDKLNRLNSKVKECYSQIDFWSFFDLIVQLLVFLSCSLDIYLSQTYYQVGKQGIDRNSVDWDIMTLYQYSSMIGLFLMFSTVIKLLKNTRMFQGLFDLLYRVIKDVMFFLISIILFTFNFSILIHLQQIHGFEALQYKDGKLVQLPHNKPYYFIIKYTANLILGDYHDLLKADSFGDFDVDDNSIVDDLIGQKTWRGILLYLTFIMSAFFLQIVMLNLIISIIAEIFNIYNQKKNDYLVYNKVQIMSEINYSLFCQGTLYKLYPNDKNYLFMAIDIDQKGGLIEQSNDAQLEQLILSVQMKTLKKIKKNSDNNLKQGQYLVDRMSIIEEFISNRKSKKSNEPQDNHSEVISQMASTFMQQHNSQNMDQIQSMTQMIDKQQNQLDSVIRNHDQVQRTMQRLRTNMQSQIGRMG